MQRDFHLFHKYSPTVLERTQSVGVHRKISSRARCIYVTVILRVVHLVDDGTLIDAPADAPSDLR
jgi:hypothetical protein